MSDPSQAASPVIELQHKLDVCGLACPLPLLKARKALRDIEVGQTLEVLATDPGSWRDFAAFAEQSGHGLLEACETQGVFRYVFKRTH
jgi:tRNA 2-thiouridine synthesizing protein A